MDFYNQMKWHRGERHKSVKVVYENKWFKIKNRDGFFALEYEVPQVVVLPVIDNNKILFVKVKRPLINDNSLELPAGGSNVGESLRQTAARELREETGIIIKDLDRF
ncbi:MAG: NUDIX hydrolase, partial [Victivallaceae bacterium]